MRSAMLGEGHVCECMRTCQEKNGHETDKKEKNFKTARDRVLTISTPGCNLDWAKLEPALLSGSEHPIQALCLGAWAWNLMPKWDSGWPCSWAFGAEIGPD